MKRTPKIGLICSPGGHLVEVLQLQEAFRDHPCFFVTYKEEATLHQENTYYVMNFARRPLSLITATFKILSAFFRERPTILFSTGAEIALPCFYLGKFLFRTKLIYLECSAQVVQPSVTGRWVYPITDLFLVQWEPLLKHYGPRAKYVGGLI